ncbi:TetR/AcrR family transcriptional regulator [Sphaerotilus sp.]|uniref:TetR/AcrR family transcriptional regulator n=1 Tax=Sphaerotilus sp. TaxID=2093942 RepID=UPI002ACDA95D|nr:TetR/AcrR family transcriptional regulator [Sphaerotilus sp.]MDZ7857992.1 TetR/AcrR family transcriptional regulator [Sphaerotilus sp.]
MRTNPPLPPLASPVWPEPSARKQHLLLAAARVFDAHGYKAATLRQIADEAGILAGSVYHHVESKEALYLEVHRTGYLRMQAAVSRVLEGQDDPWRRLELACRTHLAEMLEGDPIARVTGQGLMEPRDGPVHVALGPLRHDYEALWARLVEALPLPEGAGLDRRVLRLNLIGAMNWTRTWYRPDGALRPAELAAQLVGMLRR